MRYGLNHRGKHSRHDGKEAKYVNKHDGQHRLLLLQIAAIAAATSG
jgi:hypothetical protein